MELTPSQKQIVQDNHRYRVLNCGRQFGKTTLSVWEMLGNAVQRKGKVIPYIATTYGQARDIVWKDLKEVAHNIIVNANESRLELEVKTQDGGTSLIVLRGWESIETLRGQRFDFIVIDEVASMRNFLTNWNEVITPTLTAKRGGALFTSTPKGYNHFYDIYNYETEDSDWKSFHFTSYDNPHLSREELDSKRKNLPESAFAQEYMAEFKKMEGLVYKDFDRDRHIFDDLGLIRNRKDVIAGIDFGFNNPAAVIRIEVDGDNNYWITNEWYKTGQTEDKIADYVKVQGFNKTYPDPASPSAIEVLKRNGVNTREVNKGQDSVNSGINKVRELLKQGRLKVHRSCINTIAEFESYQYDPDAKDQKGKPLDKVLKENDHAMDAIRYALDTYQVPQQNLHNIIIENRTRRYGFE